MQAPKRQDVPVGELPANCRERLRAEGKAYPRSGCEACHGGGLFGCPYNNTRRAGAPPAFADEQPSAPYLASRLSAERESLARIIAKVEALSPDVADRLRAVAETMSLAAHHLKNLGEPEQSNDRDLSDILDVGQNKALGYLPLHTIRTRGADPKFLVMEFTERGLDHREMAEDQCLIGSGALFVWHSDTVLSWIRANHDLIVRYKWPTHPGGLVYMVASQQVEQDKAPDLYELIGHLFADKRFDSAHYCVRPKI